MSIAAKRKGEKYNHKTCRNLTPIAVANPKTGEILQKEAWVPRLKTDIMELHDLVQHELSNISMDWVKNLDSNEIFNKYTNPNTIGYYLNIKLDKEYVEYRKEKYGRTSGISRFEKIYSSEVVTQLKSWLARLKAFNGDKNNIAKGWARTVNPNRPVLTTPKMNLGYVDKQYAYVDAVTDDSFDLFLIVNHEWLVFTFPLPRRFKKSDYIGLPTIRIVDNKIVFDFSFGYRSYYPSFSSNYAIGVDVGLRDYATVSVVDLNTFETVFTTSLSQQVHSLWNSVKASELQKKSLSRKGRYDEARLHRESASRKKRELAILAAKEISFYSSLFDNALVVMEDLGWVSNTMQNGRWNRGELKKWVKHFAELNGGRVLSGNCAFTSRKCSVCCSDRIHPKNSSKVFRCVDCGAVIDRDVNAASNIILLNLGIIKKSIRTRSSRKTGNVSLEVKVPAFSSNHKGVSKSKGFSTPKNKKLKKRVLPPELKTLIDKNKVSSINLDGFKVVLDGLEHAEPGLLKSTPVPVDSVSYKYLL